MFLCICGQVVYFHSRTQLFIHANSSFDRGGAGGNSSYAGLLEPGVLVGGVVEDEVGDDAQAALVSFSDEGFEVFDRAVGGVDVEVVGDVVTVVFEGGRVHGHDPEAVHAQFLEIVQFTGQAGEVAVPVAVAVAKGADVDLIEDGVFVPEGVGGFCSINGHGRLLNGNLRRCPSYQKGLDWEPV
jgi:hypothetical protein